MLNLIKHIINLFNTLRLGQFIQIKNKSVLENSINNKKMSVQPSLPNSELPNEPIILDKPDLFTPLGSIMSQKFILLWEGDTLASAYFMVVIQGMSEIFVVDKNKRFLGVLTALDIVEKLPPALVDIPLDYQHPYMEIDYSSSTLFREISRRKLSDVFSFNKYDLLVATKKERIIDILDHLTRQHRFYELPSSIPILFQGETVIGVVKTKILLRNLINYNIETQNKPISFIADIGLTRPICCLESDNVLVDAHYALKHLPASCILVSKFGEMKEFNLITDIQIYSLIYTHYHELFELSLESISTSIPKEKIIDSDVKIQQLINQFINNRTNYVFAFSADDEQVVPKGIITVSDLIRVLLNKN